MMPFVRILPLEVGESMIAGGSHDQSIEQPDSQSILGGGARGYP